MALKIAELYAELRADTTGFVDGINKSVSAVNSAGQKIENRWKTLANNLGSTGRWMSTRVTLPIVTGFGIAAAAAADAERQLNAVRAALVNSGADADKYTEIIDELAGAIQKTTIYDDEAIKSGAALALNMGVQANQIERVIRSAVGLAAAYKIDLQTAFQLMAKAAAGNTSLLGRYGIILDQNLSQQEKFNQLLEIGASKMSIAEADAATMSGRMIQLKNSLGDMAESIGAVFMPVITVLTDKIKVLTNWFTALSPSARSWVVTFAVVAAAIGPLLVAIDLLTTSYFLLTAAAAAAKATIGGPAFWASIAAGVAVATTAVIGLKKTLDSSFASTSKAAVDMNNKLAGGKTRGLLAEGAEVAAAAADEELAAVKKVYDERKRILDLSRGWTSIEDLWKRSMTISSELGKTTAPAIGSAARTAETVITEESIRIAREQLAAERRQENYMKQLLGYTTDAAFDYGG